jgi:glyoxylase-like metal-dependent hydrolase (beta-lactamase superfamily II)
MDPYKITNEIFQVGGGRLTSSEDAAVYLININSHCALVDAGCGRLVGQLKRNIHSCHVDLDQIEYLLITHCHFDHTGGVKGLKDDLPNTIIVVHELEAPYLEQGDSTVTAARWYGAAMQPFSVDRKITGAGEDIMLGERLIKAVHVPGHSPGSMVYVMESEGNKILFGQDVHGPLDPALKSDRMAYRKSLELLLSLEADILCEGHYGVIKGTQEVMDFIESFLNKERE